MDYTVFHVSPDKEIPMSLLFDSLKDLGYEILVVSDEEFDSYVEELKSDKDGREKLEGLLADNPDMNYRFTNVSQSFTDGIIKEAGLKWGDITEEYLSRYLQVLDEFGIFEGGVI